jgi:UDP-N-acetyl-D-mannosaminuronate dehydrogenase
MKEVKVVTIGLGYIGLPTAALITQNEIQVDGVDVNLNVYNSASRRSRRLGICNFTTPSVRDFVN